MPKRPTDQDPDRFRDPEAWPYTFELLHVDWMFVDDRYQRPLTRFADEIADDFNRALLEPLLVSRRDEQRYAIADGQNRWEGARRIGERWLWCRVMHLTPQEEASLFSLLQAKRKNISPLERFKADVFAGDEDAIAVEHLLRRFEIEPHTTGGMYAKDENTITAIDAARKGYAQYGDELMARVFGMVKAAYPGERGRYSREAIRGLSGFYAKHDDVNDRRLLVALEKIGSHSKLKERSSQLRHGRGMGGGSQKYTIEVIEREYDAVARGRFRKQWDLT